MNEVILSGVLAKIYEQVCDFLGKTYHEVKKEVENSYPIYYETYRQRHGTVKLSCVEMRKPISLDDIYVGIQFLNKHTRSRYNSPEDVEQAFRGRNRRPFNSVSDPPQDGTQVATDEQYLMVLGAPGVGKSTFLRKVGLETLIGKNRGSVHGCIPVFLELRRFTEYKIDIEALITKEFGACGFPHPKDMTQAALKSGNLLILFDGLDEVPEANVNNVIDTIGDFVDQYSQNRFIASCRIAAYKGGFKRFTEVEMADFGDSQIETYIKNWFNSTTDPNHHRLDEQMKTAEQCWTMLSANEHSATKELARNPLLLTLLCMVYDDTQNFSRNRATLYADALDIFLRRWAGEKRVNRGASITQYLDIADEKWMLSEIAAKNFEENRFFFSEDELITQIQTFGESNANTLETFNARTIFDAILIDQGLFVERVRDSYSFSHLTFQEYLTANYIVGDARSIQGLVEGHLHDEQWREVFLLTAGLMRKADDLLEAMEAEAAKLINTPRLKALFQWAEQITDTSNDRYNGIAKRSFALYQFFSLHRHNEIYEAVENIVNNDQYLYRDLYGHLYQDLYLYRYLYLYIDLYLDQDQDQDLNLYQDLDRHRDKYLSRDRYRRLYRYLDLYLDRDLDRDLARSFYQDFFQYMDANFYRRVSGEFRKRFDRELQVREVLIKRMEQMKIFKSVDLQQMTKRFKAQRELIQAAIASKDVTPPVKSIHNTWLSVLGITDEMFDISRGELEIYHQYLRAVELIVACKEASGRVSPDVWQGIENRILTVNSGSST